MRLVASCLVSISQQNLVVWKVNKQTTNKIKKLLTKNKRFDKLELSKKRKKEEKEMKDLKLFTKVMNELSTLNTSYEEERFIKNIDYLTTLEDNKLMISVIINQVEEKKALIILEDLMIMLNEYKQDNQWTFLQYETEDFILTLDILR